MVTFGPAGSPDRFFSLGYKRSLQIPQFLEEIGLDLFEYQCGNGVNVGLDTARKLGDAFREKGKILSIHAPYFISLSSLEEEKRNNSIEYILRTARVASAMGAERVIVHSGSCAKLSRSEALELACQTLRSARKALCREHLEQIRLCPETMGKINQLGTLDEVLTLCGVDESFLPTVDFGHLNARTLGQIRGREDYAKLLNQIRTVLGEERERQIHVHFSKIEYTTGGEKRHLTFSDQEFGPEFEPLAELLVMRDSDAHVICESSGTQDLDALFMKSCYQNCLNGREQFQ